MYYGNPFVKYYRDDLIVIPIKSYYYFYNAPVKIKDAYYLQ